MHGHEHGHTHAHKHGHGHGCHGEGHGKHRPHHGKILGTTTVGERGQIVIPAEARTEMGISGGDKLVVFGNPHNSGITLVKAEVFDKYAEFFMTKSKKLEKLANEILSMKEDGVENEEDAVAEADESGAGADSQTDSDAKQEAESGAAEAESENPDTGKA